MKSSKTEKRAKKAADVIAEHAYQKRRDPIIPEWVMPVGIFVILLATVASWYLESKKEEKLEQQIQQLESTCKKTGSINTKSGIQNVYECPDGLTYMR